MKKSVKPPRGWVVGAGRGRGGGGRRPASEAGAPPTRTPCANDPSPVFGTRRRPTATRGARGNEGKRAKVPVNRRQSPADTVGEGGRRPGASRGRANTTTRRHSWRPYSSTYTCPYTGHHTKQPVSGSVCIGPRPRVCASYHLLLQPWCMSVCMNVYCTRGIAKPVVATMVIIRYHGIHLLPPRWRLLCRRRGQQQQQQQQQVSNK